MINSRDLNRYLDMNRISEMRCGIDKVAGECMKNGDCSNMELKRNAEYERKKLENDISELKRKRRELFQETLENHENQKLIEEKLEELENHLQQHNNVENNNIIHEKRFEREPEHDDLATGIIMAKKYILDHFNRKYGLDPNELNISDNFNVSYKETDEYSDYQRPGRIVPENEATHNVNYFLDIRGEDGKTEGIKKLYNNYYDGMPNETPREVNNQVVDYLNNNYVADIDDTMKNNPYYNDQDLRPTTNDLTKEAKRLGNNYLSGYTREEIAGTSIHN
ncbi:hypothetical protein A0H76_1299 [Hepatospora eriocheir]|uniref:Uncharacterized protein n=1 Tax=Hepatospora eriocheir TaxID=1081669 RepID=A0A1X0QHN1_9MICR|nr:hypothetical protein A0H76_1299 [Hepatospora eriocheir]